MKKMFGKLLVVSVLMFMVSCEKAPVEVVVTEIPDPTDISYEIINVHTIKISWIDNSVGEAGFYIDKKVNDDAWQIKFANVAENIDEWTDDNVESNAVIRYRVYGYNSNYTTAMVTTPEIDTTFPAPSNLQITQADVHTFNLNWQDNSNGEEGFKLQRKIDDGDFVEIAVLAENVTTFTDDINLRNNFETVYINYMLFMELTNLLSLKTIQPSFLHR